MDESRKVQEQIAKANPWYVGDQLAGAQSPQQKRTIRGRWGFVERVVADLRTARPETSLRVLDVGCGDGLLLKVLTTIPNAQLFAYDYNPVRVERAAREFPEATVEQQDITQIQGDATFDLIVCSQVLEHVEDDRRAVSELARIAAPGGRLIVGVPNEGCLLARLRNRVLERSVLAETDHVHFYTEKQMLALFAEAGLTVRETYRENFFFPLQRLHAFFARRDWGFRFMQRLQRLFPSQAAGYYFCLERTGAGEPWN